MSEDRASKLFAKWDREALEEQFASLDRRELAGWPDEKLAAWQAKHPSDSPQFILAQFEWSRRLTVEQLRAARWQAYFGIAGVVIGVILTRLLELLK